MYRKYYKFSYDIPVSNNDNFVNLYQDVSIKPSYNICIEHVGPMGELSLALYIKKAAENLGWKACLVKSAASSDAQELINSQKIDFIITLSSPKIKPVGIAPQYFYLTFGNDSYFVKSRFSSSPCFSLSSLYDYDGYILLHPNFALLKHVVEQKKKLYAAYILPSVYTFDFILNHSKRSRMYFSAGLCDIRRSSENYLRLYKLLDEAGYVDFYGPAEKWRPLNLKNWQQEIIPTNNNELLPQGVSNAEVDLQKDSSKYLDTISQYEVALALHSSEHLAQGAPTLKVFEAASVGNIIICDKNKFVVDNFQDSVLYIDVDKPAEEIFAQIDEHMKWIRNNPEAAQKLAEKARKIFVTNFALEGQLLSLARMHEACQKNKKESK